MGSELAAVDFLRVFFQIDPLAGVHSARVMRQLGSAAYARGLRARVLREGAPLVAVRLRRRAARAAGPSPVDRWDAVPLW